MIWTLVAASCTLGSGLCFEKSKSRFSEVPGLAKTFYVIFKIQDYILASYPNCRVARLSSEGLHYTPHSFRHAPQEKARVQG